jgi:hypothetical protein
MRYVESIRIRISPDSRFKSSEETLSLGFRKLSDVADLRCAFQLVAAKASERRVSSGGVSFWRKATNDETAPTQSPREPETDDRGPNAETEGKPRLRSTVGRIDAVMMFCDEWNYTSSNEDRWTDAARLACGVSGLVKWHELAWESVCATVQDLGRLQKVEVCLPGDFDLRPADEFQLTWFTSGNRIFRLRLDNLRFTQEEKSRTWSASVSGPELYAHFAEQFMEDRTRDLAGAPDDDAG